MVAAVAAVRGRRGGRRRHRGARPAVPRPEAEGSNAGAAATVDVGGGVAAAGAPGIIIPAGGGAPYAPPDGVGAWGESTPAGGVDVAYADCAGEAPYESYELCAGAGGSEGAPPYDEAPALAASYALAVRALPGGARLAVRALAVRIVRGARRRGGCGGLRVPVGGGGW